MTVIKINAITVPVDSGDELARRFAARAGAVDGQPGFEGFELLKPVDGRTQWLVVTRWADEPSFEAWRTSAAFAHGHGRPSSGQQASSGAGPVAGEATHHGTRPARGEVAPGALADPDPDEAPPVAGEATGHGTHPVDDGQSGGGAADQAASADGHAPVGVAAELWSFEVAVVNESATP